MEPLVVSSGATLDGNGGRGGLVILQHRTTMFISEEEHKRKRRVGE